MNKLIQFKTDIIKSEFESDKLNDILIFVLYSLAGYVNYKFNKSLVLTEIFRTQEMQDKYYANDPAYKKKKWQSVHQYRCAVDISAIYFTQEEITNMLFYVNTALDYGQGKLMLIYHDIGYGAHFHLQTPTSRKPIFK